MKKTKNIELKSNFLNIRKDFLRTSFIIFIGLMLLVAAIVLVVRDSPFDKAMNELDKAELEMDKALSYVALKEYAKSDIAFEKSMEHIDIAASYIDGKDLSEKQTLELVERARDIILVKGITFAFSRGFSEFADIFT